MASPIEKNNILLEGVKPLTAAQKKLFKYFGKDSKIKPPYRILNPQRIHIGDRTSIQEYSHMAAFSDLTFLMDYIDPKFKKSFKAADYKYDSQIHIDRECQIGRFFFSTCTRSIRLHANVLVSERVFIGDNNHTFKHPQVPIMQQPNSKGEPIEVGKGAWIGVGAVILKGTTLGQNSVIAANAVVEGDFPARSVIGSDKARLLYRIDENV